MKSEVQALLDLAGESIAASGSLLRDRHARFSVSRAYYAMFYVAEALHLAEGRSYSKHSAVISNFGRHFVKTGRFDARFHRYLRKAFEDRQRCDYEASGTISDRTARSTIAHANEFLTVARSFIQEEADG